MPVLGNCHSRVIKSLGLVFGDIGTSPIYTVGAILLFLLPTTGNILGIISLLVWTLFIIISVQYVWLAMSLLYFPTTRFYKISPFYSISLPMISFLYTGMTIHSALRHLLGSGGRWKGRSY